LSHLWFLFLGGLLADSDLSSENPCFWFFSKQVYGTSQSFPERDAGFPAQSRQSAHIQLFFWGSVGLAGVPTDLALETGGYRHCLGQLPDA
jgi:hypothetical protein